MSQFQPLRRDQLIALPLISKEITDNHQEIEREVSRIDSRMKTEAFVIGFFMLATLAGGIYLLATSGGPTNALVFYGGVGSLALFCVLSVSLVVIIKKEKNEIVDVREEEQTFLSGLIGIDAFFNALTSRLPHLNLKRETIVQVLSTLTQEQFNLVAKYALQTIFGRSENGCSKLEERLLDCMLRDDRLNPFDMQIFNEALCLKILELARANIFREPAEITKLIIKSLDNDAFALFFRKTSEIFSQRASEHVNEDEILLLGNLVKDIRFAGFDLKLQWGILNKCYSDVVENFFKEMDAEKYHEQVQMICHDQELCKISLTTCRSLLLANDLILSKPAELLFLLNQFKASIEFFYKYFIERFDENNYMVFAEKVIEEFVSGEVKENILAAIAQSCFVSSLRHEQKVLLMKYKCSLVHLKDDFIEQTFGEMSREEKFFFITFVPTTTLDCNKQASRICTPIVVTQDFANLFENGSAVQEDWELLQMILLISPYNFGAYIGSKPEMKHSKMLAVCPLYLEDKQAESLINGAVDSAKKIALTPRWINCLKSHLTSQKEIPLLMQRIFAGLPIPLVNHVENFANELKPILALQTLKQKVDYYRVLHAMKKDYFLGLATQELKQVSIAMHEEDPQVLFKTSPIVNYLNKAPKEFLRQHVIENKEIHEKLEFRYLFALELLKYTLDGEIINALDENQAGYYTALLLLLMEEAHKCDPNSITEERKHLMELFYNAPQYKTVNKFVLNRSHVESFENLVKNNF